MSRKLKIDHSRGLCGQPDVGDTIAREEVEKNPAHCRCCGSEMQIKECGSSGMQQLGMFWLICPTCPPPKPAQKREGRRAREL
jgi:hypothetical protein